MTGAKGDLSTSPRQNAAYWKYQALHNRELLKEAEDRVQEQEAEIHRLRQALYGKKTEQGKGRTESGTPDASARSRGHRKGVPSPGRTRHPDLPAEVEIVDLPPGERTCSVCHKSYAPFGSEISEILEIDVRPHRRIVHRNRYRKTCSCPGEKGIRTAPPPPRLIPKGLLGISIWVEVLLFKFARHLPLSRLLLSWQERGLVLSPGTIASGLERFVPLLAPLQAALVRKSREASFSQADETRYFVFGAASGSNTSRWWAWVILTPETSLFVLDPSRSSKVPLAHFAGRPGVLMVDRYSAYKATARQTPGLLLAFCWSHVRRDFLQAAVKRPDLASWAHFWIDRIGTLFHETVRMRAGLLPSRLAVLSLLSEMKETAVNDADRTDLPGDARKVLRSLLSHWDGLTLFVDDPRIPLDNNASERALRGLVVGRKVFHGAGARWSGDLAMTLYSLFSTWDRAGLNLRTTLADYLAVCARSGAPPSDLSPWLPWEMSPERKETLSRPSFRETG